MALPESVDIAARVSAVAVDAPASATNGRRGRRRRWRVARAVLLVFLAPFVVSYIGALRAPGTDSVSARSVEWLRSHQFGGVVNSVESWWYSHHPPPLGGKPKGGIPAVPAPQGVAIIAPGRHVVVGLARPIDIQSAAGQRLPGEGVWKPTGVLVHGRPAVYFAYVRPDAIHTSLLSGVAWFDTRLLRAALIPGLSEPPGADKSFGARVPPEERSNLVAAFNSAFRVSDSGGGYYERGRTLAGLVNGAASAVLRTDGTMTVGQWGRDFTGTHGIAVVRQNLRLIVDHSTIVPGLPKNASGSWGKTLNSKIYVWRSGVGVTRSGAIVYVAGGGLSVESVADLLQRAGAVRGMELDINPEWVSCFVYDRPTPSDRANVVGRQLLGSGQRSNDRYLVPGTRDFFAWFARA